MFPGPGAQIYKNEAGEVLGWDYPSYDEPYEDDFEQERRYQLMPPCEGCGQHPEDCDCYCSRCGEASMEFENFTCTNMLCLDNLELLFPRGRRLLPTS
jgi:hypothetical protein